MTRPPLFMAIAAILSACGGQAPPPETPPPSNDDPVTYAVALRFEDAGTDGDETPHTAVSLVRIAPDGQRRVVSLREETGACFADVASGAMLAGRCWWAGFGARYEVRREADAVVAYRADQDEEAADSPFVEVGRFELDRDADVEVLTPGRSARD
ncbi:MAG: hypothetical protein AB8I08_13875 [Sandaracinaceae bacterium]